MRFISQSPNETQKIASKVAKKILSSPVGKMATIMVLEGELGAGKTVFVKGFAKALGIKKKINSPTFVILKKIQIPEKIRKNKSAGFQFLFHIDAYRLKNHKELVALGIGEILKNPENIVLIEWAERVRKILPTSHVKIHLDHIGKDKRSINVKF